MGGSQFSSLKEREIKVDMWYIVYLVVMTICMIWGIGYDKLLNFLDTISLMFVILPCIIALVSSGYIKAFIRAFHIIFKEKLEGIEDSIESIKLVCLISIVSGCLGFVISIINMLKSMDLSASYIGADISVAMICIFYSLLIELIFIPVYFKLKQLKKEDNNVNTNRTGNKRHRNIYK